MKITNENKSIAVAINEVGEISSIKFHDEEVLHDGSQWWAKTFPMIWPNLSFSNGFIVKDKNYELPKHGFWKTLKWDWFFEDDTLMVVATHFKNELYPFSVDINLEIYIEDNTVHMNTHFTNVDRNSDAYFHFGLHPAFKIETSSRLKYTGKNPTQLALDGKHIDEEYELVTLMDPNYSTKFDTLVFKNHEWDTITLSNDNYNLHFTTDANNTQLWKPKDALFICIEPWYGVNDAEYDAPKEAKLKQQINMIKPGETWSAYNSIRFEKK